MRTRHTLPAAVLLVAAIAVAQEPPFKGGFPPTDAAQKARDEADYQRDHRLPVLVPDRLVRGHLQRQSREGHQRQRELRDHGHRPAAGHVHAQF
jgi:hypothetical protein